MTLDRRQALGLFGLVAAPLPARAAEKPVPASFQHGVASGDPLTDRVILWTRATPERPGPVQVSWEVAEAPDFKTVVAKGTAVTGPGRDHTVKVDVAGLKPGRDYHYRFKAGATVSPVGRTRTLPTGALDQAVLAFVNCALYPGGYFNAYDHLSKRERLDAVICLGDYIYEYGAGPTDYGMDNGRALGRIPEPPHETVTLSDYRMRYAQYRRDLDLQAAHARAPWICVWDDHDISNDAWAGGAQNHQPATEGPWLVREAAALQAYYEWMPIREPKPGQAEEAIYRSFHFGDLASLIMVESRLVARSQQITFERSAEAPYAVYTSDDPDQRQPVTDPVLIARVRAADAAGQTLPPGAVIGPDPAALRAAVANPERQMLGVRQEQWLAAELAASAKAGRTWQVIGNESLLVRHKGPNVRRKLGREATEKMLAALPPSSRGFATNLVRLLTYDLPYSYDRWDGYPAARQRVYEGIKASGGNVVVVSGDSHAFWANDLLDDSAQPVAVEFGVGATSSPPDGVSLSAVDLGQMLMDDNPEVKFCDQKSLGYVLLTLAPDAVTADLVSVETLVRPYTSKSLGRFRVRPKRPRVEQL